MKTTPPCLCDTRDHWRVVDRECNYSTFSGGRWTPSDYSLVVCGHYLGGCGGTWRTKAKYVDGLQDVDRDAWMEVG